jgi:hypothetical protein
VSPPVHENQLSKSNKLDAEAIWLYRKRRDTKVDGGLMSFWCISCESLGVSSIAHVRKHFGGKGPTFTHESFDQDHQCVPSAVQQLVVRFKKQLYQEVANYPLKSLNIIYQETTPSLLTN